MKSMLLIAVVSSFFSCARIEADNKIADLKNVDTTSNYMFLPTHSIKGDFNGDAKVETLVSFISDSTGKKVDKIPAGDDWGATLEYVFAKGINTKLFIEGSTADTLNLGTSMGVYCLINLGDTNNDKKDEIVLVPDWPDYSNLNRVRIYSLCSNKWIELENFSVNEGNSFDWNGDVMPIFNTIPGALEKHGGKWMFRDFDEWMETGSAKMRHLKLQKCK